MRSETETDRKFNPTGAEQFGDKSSVPVEDEPLKWRRPSPDGTLIKELTRLVGMAGAIIQKDAKKTLKQLKKMEKTING
jgi:hypothetical protein